MERLFAPARAGRLSVLEVGSLRGFLRRGESVEYGDEGERGLVIGFDTAESLTARDKALLDEGPCAGAIYVPVRKYSLCAYSGMKWKIYYTYLLRQGYLPRYLQVSPFP